MLQTEVGYTDVDDAFFDGTARALERWARSSPDSISPLLELLAANQHEAAQSLLFKTLIAGAATFSAWAAELILQGGNRLEAGYLFDQQWLSRELIEAIAPLVSSGMHLQLEEALRDARARYQSTDPYGRLRSFGYVAFKFLSALDRSRLTPLGVRRLQEYQRKFHVDAPEPPAGIISYTVGSPIAESATGKMTNPQWLRAIAKHAVDDREIGSQNGGPRELSHLLAQKAAEDPLRFAGLAMALTAHTNEAYPVAILRGFGEATIPADVQPAVFLAIRHIMSLRLSECDRWLGWAVQRVYEDTPLDIVEMLLDRALNAPDPVDNQFAFGCNDSKPGRSLFHKGINTARGSLTNSLGNLLIHDANGARTQLVAPHLIELASDPVLSVRSCVAHTIAACLRHARSTAYEAFDRLIETDDLLLASDKLDNLMIYIGNADPERIDRVIDRMLSSGDAEARRVGGVVAAFAALQWGRPAFMERALAGDIEVRSGAAEVCAARVDRSADSELVMSALRRLMHDDEDGVRRQVGTLASHLRGKELRPYAPLLTALIASPSYTYATPQLLITLQEALDRVDDLVGLAAHRFLDIYGSDVADIRTGAAGDANYISDLVIRGLAQTHDRDNVAALLDVLDRLLELGVYGVDQAIEGAVRG